MGSKKPKLAKGTEELLEIMQDQTKEFKVTGWVPVLLCVTVCVL